MCRWWTSSLRPRRSPFTTGDRCGDDGDVRYRDDYREADTSIDVSKGGIGNLSFTSRSLGIFPITIRRNRALRRSQWHSFQVLSIYHIQARIQDDGKLSGISDWSRFGAYVPIYIPCSAFRQLSLPAWGNRHFVFPIYPSELLWKSRYFERSGIRQFRMPPSQA